MFVIDKLKQFLKEALGYQLGKHSISIYRDCPTRDTLLGHFPWPRDNPRSRKLGDKSIGWVLSGMAPEVWPAPKSVEKTSKSLEFNNTESAATLSLYLSSTSVPKK